MMQKADGTEDHRVVTARLRRERMRHRLLDATMAVCARIKGREPLLVEEIVRYAGVSRGAFYTQFTALDEALDVLGRNLAEDMTLGLLPVYDTLTQPLQRVAVGNLLFLRRAELEPLWGRFVSRSKDLFQGPAALGRLILQDLANGQACGDFKYDSPDAAFDLLMGTMLEAMRRIDRNDGRNDAYSSEVAQMILRGLGVTPELSRDTVEFAVAYIEEKVPGALAWWPPNAPG